MENGTGQLRKCPQGRVVIRPREDIGQTVPRKPHLLSMVFIHISSMLYDKI